MHDFIISLGPGVAVEEKGKKKKKLASEVNRVGGLGKGIGTPPFAPL